MPNKKENRFRRFARRIIETSLHRRTKHYDKQLMGKRHRIVPEIACETGHTFVVLSPEGLKNGRVESRDVEGGHLYLNWIISRKTD